MAFAIEYRHIYHQNEAIGMGKSERIGLSDGVAHVAQRKLPVPAEQLPTGTVIVHPPKTPATEAVALHARVASTEQKADLERQLGRLADYASREGLTVVRSVAEIGSGLNGHRAKIMRLLSDAAVQTIVVEHRDRLTRFGAEYIEAALAACGRKLVVVDESEMKDDLVQDMVDVLKIARDPRVTQEMYFVEASGTARDNCARANWKRQRKAVRGITAVQTCGPDSKTFKALRSVLGLP